MNQPSGQHYLVLPETPPKTETAVGYFRVSTAGQANEGVSLEAQQAKIAAWCDANGYELAGVYTDAGLSGKRADNRPELQRALKAAGRGRATHP